MSVIDCIVMIENWVVWWI